MCLFACWVLSLLWIFTQKEASSSLAKVYKLRHARRSWSFSSEGSAGCHTDSETRHVSLKKSLSPRIRNIHTCWRVFGNGNVTSCCGDLCLWRPRLEHRPSTCAEINTLTILAAFQEFNTMPSLNSI